MSVPEGELIKWGYENQGLFFDWIAVHFLDDGYAVVIPGIYKNYSAKHAG